MVFLEAEVLTIARTNKGDAIFIKPLKRDKFVPIFIRPVESQAILFALSNIPSARPLTHDLLIDIINKLRAVVERIEIPYLKDQTFYSRIILRQGMRKIQIDARPSDSLNIAHRCGCPLFIAESIVETVGVPLSFLAERQEEEEKATLQQQLKRAIASENYEEAARIRDKLNSL